MPPRTENVHEVDLSSKDRELYEFFKERCSSLAAGDSKVVKTGRRRKNEQKEGKILALINFLRLICDHGEQILPAAALDAWQGRDRTAIDWSMIQACRAKCYICDNYFIESDVGASGGHQYSCQHSACFPCASHNGDIDAEQAQPCPKCRVSRKARVDSCTTNYSGAPMQPSSKVEALLKNLQAEQADGWKSQGTTPVKSVIFSCWTKMLDLVRQALQANKLGFERVDGQTSLDNRSKAINRFTNDPTCTVMLASISAAGEGIDLKAANHVHLMEPQWNPMAEAQAVNRVHRIGQEREVWITRYIVSDSIETYIQRVQADKLRLIEKSLNSLDESQTETDFKRWKKLQTFLSSRKLGTA